LFSPSAIRKPFSLKEMRQPGKRKEFNTKKLKVEEI
jgi:hypothetical protein